MERDSIAKEMSEFVDYWEVIHKRKPTMAEREAYLMGRVHELQASLEFRLFATSKVCGTA